MDLVLELMRGGGGSVRKTVNANTLIHGKTGFPFQAVEKLAKMRQK